MPLVKQNKIIFFMYKAQIYLQYLKRYTDIYSVVLKFSREGVC